jgi:hypothetical protein
MRAGRLPSSDTIVCLSARKIQTLTEYIFDINFSLLLEIAWGRRPRRCHMLAPTHINIDTKMCLNETTTTPVQRPASLPLKIYPPLSLSMSAAPPNAVCRTQPSPGHRLALTGGRPVCKEPTAAALRSLPITLGYYLPPTAPSRRVYGWFARRANLLGSFVIQTGRRAIDNKFFCLSDLCHRPTARLLLIQASGARRSGEIESKRPTQTTIET